MIGISISCSSATMAILSSIPRALLVVSEGCFISGKEKPGLHVIPSAGRSQRRKAFW